MDAQFPMIEGVRWSATEWADWIAQQVLVREEIFSKDPDELIAAYRREIGHKRDYHGRELLELLQNADDAGVDYGQASHAIIVLTQEGLCVGNAGSTFSTGGVKSLMISDNSPKQFARARYIGNRGLGFRSILSWTDCPFVLSGNLNLSFDRERACRWLEKLCAEYPAIRAKVAFLQQTAMGWPVPTLVVPTFLDSHCENANVWPNEQTFSSIWQTAHELRAMGYDTIIGIPFTTDDAFDEVSSQLGQIGREVMLFLRNLDELVIRQPDGT